MRIPMGQNTMKLYGLTLKGVDWMIHEVRVTDIKSMMELLTEQRYDETIKRYRSPYVYRGIPNVDFKLETVCNGTARINRRVWKR